MSVGGGTLVRIGVVGIGMSVGGGTLVGIGV